MVVYLIPIYFNLEDFIVGGSEVCICNLCIKILIYQRKLKKNSFRKYIHASFASCVKIMSFIFVMISLTYLLYRLQKEKYECPYTSYITPAENESYIDLKTFHYTWDRPKEISECRYITYEDIQVKLTKLLILI